MLQFEMNYGIMGASNVKEAIGTKQMSREKKNILTEATIK